MACPVFVSGISSRTGSADAKGAAPTTPAATSVNRAAGLESRGVAMATPPPIGRTCLPERRPGAGRELVRIASAAGRALQFVAAVLQNGRGGEFYVHGKKFITSLSLCPLYPPQPCKTPPAILEKLAHFVAQFDCFDCFTNFFGLYVAYIDQVYILRPCA